MTILKKLRNALSLGVLLALMSFRLSEPNAHPDIVGEWSSLSKDQAVKSITFFSTGMVHVLVKGNRVMMANYKTDKPGKGVNNEITGKMYVTSGRFLVESRNSDANDNTIPFTASIKEGKNMSLRLGKATPAEVVSLVKARELGSDLILIK
jgi:hypothetical protein